MGKNNGKAPSQEVSPKVQREMLSHEVKRLERELQKVKEQYRETFLLFCVFQKTDKELSDARAKITEVQKRLDQANGHLTMAQVNYERTLPRIIRCGECSEPFPDAEMFQRHLKIAKARGVHCLYFRQGL